MLCFMLSYCIFSLSKSDNDYSKLVFSLVQFNDYKRFAKYYKSSIANPIYSKTGNTLLTASIEAGSNECAMFLMIVNPQIINTRSLTGMHPISYAIKKNNNILIMAILLYGGKYDNLRNCYGWNNDDVLRHYYRSVFQRYPRTTYNQISALALVVNIVLSINQTSQTYYPAIPKFDYYDIIFYDIPLLPLLIFQFDNLCDCDGNNILHYIASRKFTDKNDILNTVKYKYIKKPNTQNIRGETPLHLSIYSNNRIIATLLLRAGANIEIPDKWGYTPIQLATALQNKEMIKLLTKWEQDNTRTKK